ncbi:hypothetical protein LTR53_017482 [Teratosphaeriaceae sp. CCFEE 6253]|nr:hypothetical protein LTR53_017482 [Teratosphaeriaceae sp. CCFEE 6253]
MGNSVGFSTEGVPDHGWKIYIASTSLIIGSGLFVVARCTARIRAKQLGADDAAIVASLLFSIILSVSLQLAVVHGYGQHKADLTKLALHRALFWFFIEQIQYKMVICLNKVSVVLLAKRIFIVKAFQIQCWIVLGMIISWTIASVAATIWQCVPVGRAWNTTVTGTCIDTSMFWMAYAIINILTDVIVIALPIPQVLRLNLNRRQKILLCGVFSLGGFVVICSIMRIIAVVHAETGKKDTTWDFVPRNVWSLVETNVGIICACLPVLKTPILRGLTAVFGKTRPDTGRAYELYGASDPHKRSKSGHRKMSKDPWSEVREDGASDEVHIVGGVECAEPRATHDLDFGFGKNRGILVENTVHIERGA